MSFGPSRALRVDPHRVYLLAQIDGVRIEVGLTGSNVGIALRGVPMAKILAEWRGLGWLAQSRGTVRNADRPAPDAITHADID